MVALGSAKNGGVYIFYPRNGREWGEHGLEEFLEVKSVYGYE
jgi:acyl-CoA reductase-like NAD-dependent aldehyde dehydrogenase